MSLKESRCDDLDDDAAIERRFGGHEDMRHAAATELAFDVEASGEGVTKVWCSVAHAAPGSGTRRLTEEVQTGGRALGTCGVAARQHVVDDQRSRRRGLDLNLS